MLSHRRSPFDTTYVLTARFFHVHQLLFSGDKVLKMRGATSYPYYIGKLKSYRVARKFARYLQPLSITMGAN